MKSILLQGDERLHQPAKGLNWFQHNLLSIPDAESVKATSYTLLLSLGMVLVSWLVMHR